MSWVTRQVIGKKNLKEVSLKQRWEKYKNKNLSRNFSFISKHMRMGENYMAIIRKKKKCFILWLIIKIALLLVLLDVFFSLLK